MEELSADEAPGMTFDIASPHPGTAVVTIRGELDLGNVDQLAEAVAPVIETAPARLILEVGELRFADSSAIALWVRWAKAVAAIELRDASALLRRVITTMGLGDTLPLRP
jgi:anti-anti-sigma factor